MTLIRLIDIIFSLTALIVLSPFFLIVIVILKFTGEGEIFFSQKRIGYQGKTFKVFKFVTMLKNSENIGTGTVTIKNDPRVLPFGKFLRKTKINELPQLINVLLGNMSFIGPRPQDERCFNAFPLDKQQIITSVHPGLSGIGSIVFRDEEQLIDGAIDPDKFYDQIVMPYKAELEEWYVKNISVRTYFTLFFLTILVVILPVNLNISRIIHSIPMPPSSIKRKLNF
jgi:lipopolysaccharide/colanic/teichoic acid biosynthesis glycosyltransferase